MDDDQHLRLWFQIFLSMCLLTIFLWTGYLLVLVGLLLVPLLSFALPRLIDFVSTAGISLIYGTYYSDPSYENRFYRDDMDKAKRLVREKRWNEAISAYREIIEKAPKMYEARFNLARVYQMAGQLGLALHEYDKLRNLKSELGPNHPFVLESERAFHELRKIISETREEVFPPA